MANYNYASLDGKEFEELSRDLLQKKLEVFLESFKSGKDKGIDLRYSTDGKEHSIIIQAKQYFKSNFDALFRKLQKELPLVRLLAPARYILTTSLGLSYGNKKKIMQLFEGYIQNTEDILGQDDLNNLLNNNQDVLRVHDKLYLTSVTIINEIINRHIKSRSKFKLEEIQKTIPIYVKHSKYDDAIKIINKEHFLIVTGEPGVGKTSLANYVSHLHLAEGFNFVYVINDINEAEKFLDDDERHLFYFDDFLGANYLKIKQNANHDVALLTFIKRIKENKNKRLILTSRTSVLNLAKTDFVRLKAPEIDISQYEVKINDFSFKDKALVLYSHLFHSDLPVEFVESIVSEKKYLKIITHSNYSPRIIDHVTKQFRLKNIGASEYFEFVMTKLEHPDDVWKDPYETDISEAGKFLLQTLFSLPANINEQLLSEAFNERIAFEVQNNGYTRSSSLYLKTLQELLGGYIHRRITDSGSFIQFFNPSFADFMSHHLIFNIEDAHRILTSAIYTSQFTNSFTFKSRDVADIDFLREQLAQMGIVYQKSVEKVKVERSFMLACVRGKADFIKPPETRHTRELALISFLLSTFSLEEVGDLVLDLYRYLDITAVPLSQFEDLLKLTDIFEDKDSEIFRQATGHWNAIVLELFKRVKYDSDFARVRTLFDDYNFDYDHFILLHGEELQAIVDSFWADSEIEKKLDNVDTGSIYTIKEMKEKLSEIEDEVLAINNELGLSSSPAFEGIFGWEYETQVEENNRDNLQSDFQAPLSKTSEPVEDTAEILKQVEGYFTSLLQDRVDL